MRVAAFSVRSYERAFFESANRRLAHELVYIEARLTPETVPAAAGFRAVCVFVNDMLSAPVLDALCRQGTSLVALRCAGFNNVDLAAAETLNLSDRVIQDDVFARRSAASRRSIGASRSNIA